MADSSDTSMARWVADHPGWCLAALLLTAAALYARVVGYDIHPLYDDALYLLERPEVRDWWEASWSQRLLTPDTGYGVPVPTFIYAHVHWLFPEHWIQVLHGLQVAGHLVNIALVWLLARRWWGDAVGTTVATLWGLHPVAVETVAWLANLKGVLLATFAFGTMVTWESYIDEKGRLEHLTPVGVIMVLGGLLALGCRPDAAVLPLMWLLQTWRRGKLREYGIGLAAVAIPFVLLTAIYLPLAMQGQAEVVDGLAVRDNLLWDRWVRVTNALEIAARSIVLPIDLDPAYFLRGQETFVRTIPGGVLLVGFAVLLVALPLLHRWALWFPLAWTAVAYGPYSQLVAIPRISADSYLYVPGFGAIGFGVLLLFDVFGAEFNSAERLRPSEKQLFAVVFGAGLLATTTHFQIERWRSPVELWKPVSAEYPKVWRPYMHIGHHYIEQEKYRRAFEISRRALPLYRAAGEYPTYLSEIYAAAGYERKALDLALESLLEDRDPGIDHYANFLKLLVRHDFDLPSHSESEALLRRSVRAVNEATSGEWERKFRLRVARWLIERGSGELARELLESEFAATRTNCLAWELRQKWRAETGEHFDGPPKPPRCKEETESRGKGEP